SLNKNVFKSLNKLLKDVMNNKKFNTSGAYRLYNFPKLSTPIVNQLESMLGSIRSKSQPEAKIIEALLNMNGKSVLAVYNKQPKQSTIELGIIENRWDNVNHNKNKVFIFDATAKTDPYYWVSNAPKIIDFDDNTKYPNLKLVFYSKHDIHRGAIRDNKDGILNKIKKILDNHNDENILVVTSNECEGSVIQTLRTNNISVEHFGNLKGKNEYMKHHVILFTNVWRREDLDYTLLAKEIDSTLHLPRLWKKKRETIKKKVRAGISIPLTNSQAEFNNQSIENVRTSLMTTDIIQDVFRTAIRSKNTADVTAYLPIENPDLILKLIAAFPGCKPIIKHLV
ncbi:MAG: hypothetical protein NTY22_09185, partial [Proteobacteria bacterium]|nr:hypothetical protein [Pseudomonadota bacterium]